MPGSREGAVTCSNMLHIAALSQHTSRVVQTHRSLANTQTNEMARSCTAEQKPEPKNLILLLLCNANLKNPPKTVKFLSAPLTRHPSRHMQSCFPGRPPPPLTCPQKPSCPDDLRNANIPQKLANGRCGSVHVFRREKGAPSTEVRGTGLVVERLHGGG